MIEMTTPSGEKHGLVNVLANSSPDNGFKNMSEVAKAKAEKMKKEDNRKVKARYLNHNGEHERLEKPYCRWAGDPIMMWRFIPGHVYEVPLGLVNEINNSPGLPQRSEVLDSNGVPTKRDGANKRIHEFVPVGF